MDGPGNKLLLAILMNLLQQDDIFFTVAVLS